MVSLTTVKWGATRSPDLGKRWQSTGRPVARAGSRSLVLEGLGTDLVPSPLANLSGQSPLLLRGVDRRMDTCHCAPQPLV